MNKIQLKKIALHLVERGARVADAYVYFNQGVPPETITTCQNFMQECMREGIIIFREKLVIEEGSNLFPAFNPDYPLYPTLTEEGEAEAQEVLNSFKGKAKVIMGSLLDELLGELYCDVATHIGSDSWTNYRNAMMEGFKGYGKGAVKHTHDFKELRQSIYKNNKEEIVKDLNQDLVKEVEELKNHIEVLLERERQL